MRIRMERITKAPKKQNPTPAESEQNSTTADTFTADMRFIVTRNKRNIWMDELYDSPPDSADLPVFN